MSIGELMGQSAILTVIGMGIVFSFLIIMVAVLSIASRILRPKAAGPAAIPQKGIDSNVLAAITAAVNHHRTINS